MTRRRAHPRLIMSLRRARWWWAKGHAASTTVGLPSTALATHVQNRPSAALVTGAFAARSASGVMPCACMALGWMSRLPDVTSASCTAEAVLKSPQPRRTHGDPRPDPSRLTTNVSNESPDAFQTFSASSHTTTAAASSTIAPRCPWGCGPVDLVAKTTVRQDCALDGEPRDAPRAVRGRRAGDPWNEDAGTGDSGGDARGDDDGVPSSHPSPGPLPRVPCRAAGHKAPSSSAACVRPDSSHPGSAEECHAKVPAVSGPWEGDACVGVDTPRSPGT